jgi:hypothetical protein
VIDLEGRVFRLAETSAAGQADGETVYQFRQNGPVLIADYAGGRIRRGQLIGVIAAEDEFEARFQHVDADGALMTGTSRGTVSRLADGRLRIEEDWQWTCGDARAGSSVIEEARD